LEGIKNGLQSVRGALNLYDGEEMTGSTLALEALLVLKKSTQSRIVWMKHWDIIKWMSENS
jgi:hypothetical protein